MRCFDVPHTSIYMNCLQGWIGYKGMSPAPTSGLFVNSLPGITQELLTYIFNTDQANVANLWADIETRVLRRFDNLLESKLKARYRLKRIPQSVDLLKDIDQVNNQTAAAAQWRGFSAEVAFPNTQKIVASAFQTFFLQSFSIYLPFTYNTITLVEAGTLVAGDTFTASLSGATGTIVTVNGTTLTFITNTGTLQVNDVLTGAPSGGTGTVSALSLAAPVVKLFDIEYGTILDSYTIASPQKGWNSIQVNKYYTSYRVMLGYDGTLINSVSQNISNDMLQLWGGIVDFFAGYLNNKAIIRGLVTPNLQTPLYPNYNQAFNIFGLTAVFSIQCRYDALVCNNKDNFTLPLWWLYGIEVLTEALYTNRLNKYTTVQKKELAYLRSDYEAEFASSFDIAVSGLDLNEDDVCLECFQKRQIHEMTP